MNTIAYCQPLVPPEWIAAHGLRPRWLRLGTVEEGATARARRGVCPVAGAIVDAVSTGLDVAAIVLTTTCDQIRYAAALLEHLDVLPVFLMNVPRTWQTVASRSLYRDELRRLGEFLVEVGGKTPAVEDLRKTMTRYDGARAEVRRQRRRMSAGEFAESIARVRGDLAEDIPSGEATSEPTGPGDSEKIPLAIVGGPMLEHDAELLRIVERAGGRIVLDASESGERTLPPPLAAERLREDPFEELARAYFDAIPDVFRRPNDSLYAWLRRELSERGHTGVIVRRYVWCDLWHAEMPRLRQLGVPVLELDAVGVDHNARLGVVSRLEAFLEMLQ